MWKDFHPLHSIKTRVTLFSVGVFLLGIWSLAFYMRELLQDDIQRMLSDQQIKSVELLSAEVNYQMQERLQGLERVAQMVTPSMMRDHDILQAFLESRPYFLSQFNAGAYLTDANGNIVAAAPLSVGQIAQHPLYRDYMKDTLRAGLTRISPPTISRQLQTPMFAMSTPVRDASGKVLGALVGVVDLSRRNFLDALLSGRYGESGYYLLEDAESRLIITGTDKRRVLQPLPAPGVSPLIDRHVQGFDETGITVNPFGVQVLATAKRIPAAGWFMVAALPTEEAFAPVRRLQSHILIATVLLSLLVAGFTWWMLRRQLSPMLLATRKLAALTPENLTPQSLPVSWQDEVGSLIGGFNQLLNSMLLQEKALKDSEARLSATFNSALDAVVTIDSESCVLEFNPAAEHIFGWKREEVLGRNISEFMMPKSIGMLHDDFVRRFIETHEPRILNKRIELTALRREGSEFPAELTVTHIRQNDKDLFTAFIRDISEQKAAAHQLVQLSEGLRESEKRLNTLLDSTKIHVWSFDGERYLYTNKQYFEFTGQAPSDALTLERWTAAVHPDDLPQANKIWMANWKTKTEHDNYFRLRRHDGVYRDFYCHAAPIFNDQGEFQYFQGVNLDITERKLLEKALQENEEFVRNVIDSVPDEIAVLDGEGVIIAANRAWCEFSIANSCVPGQTTAHTSIGDNYLQACKPNRKGGGDKRSHDGICSVLIGKADTFHLEYKCDTPTARRWFRMSVAPLAKKGNGAVVSHTDITELKLAEERIRQLAYYDELTQLPNRRLLNDRLTQAMAVSKRTGNYGAVMFLDLDNFKPLNDTHGHKMGDLLLVEAANRIKSCLREMDTVARFGGDEFVVMLGELGVEREASLAQAKIVAEKILLLLSTPYLLTPPQQGKTLLTVEHHCTASIGVALFLNHNGSQEDVLKWADQAMYQAKEAGRSRVSFYEG